MVETSDVVFLLRRILKHETEVDINHDDWYQFHFCTIICIEINRNVSFLFFFFIFDLLYVQKSWKHNKRQWFFGKMISFEIVESKFCCGRYWYFYIFQHIQFQIFFRKLRTVSSWTWLLHKWDAIVVIRQWCMHVKCSEMP